MFTLQELEEDPAALLEIKEDIREECGKLGNVTNVVLFDAEPEGIVSVRFSDAAAARECISVMNGRHFGGQQVEARIADGSERYKKKKKEGADEEEAERLDEFGEWLEQDGQDS
jgi:HIV Tat-specific factor 1